MKVASIALGLLVASCATPAPGALATHHWLLLVGTTPQGLQVVQRTVVQGPVPEDRHPTQQAVRFTVRDREGHDLYSGTRADPRFVRAELPGSNQGVTQPLLPVPGGASFLLRIPELPEAATLTLEPSGPGVDFPATTLPLDVAAAAP